MHFYFYITCFVHNLYFYYFSIFISKSNIKLFFYWLKNHTIIPTILILLIYSWYLCKYIYTIVLGCLNNKDQRHLNKKIKIFDCYIGNVNILIFEHIQRAFFVIITL